jgi:hypothetical protein
VQKTAKSLETLTIPEFNSGQQRSSLELHPAKEKHKFRSLKTAKQPKKCSLTNHRPKLRTNSQHVFCHQTKAETQSTAKTKTKQQQQKENPPHFTYTNEN